MIRPGVRKRFWLALFGRRQAEQQVTEEIAHHLRQRAQQFTRLGMSSDDARREAERRFGTIEAAHADLTALAVEHHRARRTQERWSELTQDVRHALRGFRREPRFFTFVISLLGLGIGVNLAAYNALDRLVLTGPKHVRAPDELHRVRFSMRQSSGTDFSTQITWFASFTAITTNARSTSGVAAYKVDRCCAVLGAAAEATPIVRGAVTSGFFALLGVTPVLGRFFSALEDDTNNPQRVAVLSYARWQQQFGGDRAVIGKQILIDGVSHEVVGVAPSGFTGVDLEPVDVWLPMSLVGASISPGWASTWRSQWIRLLVRTRPNITATQAGEDLTAAFRNAYTGSSESWARATLALERLRSSATLPAQGRISKVVAIVTIVLLLVACANVANLQLARTVRRRQEVAVRLALGSGLGRIRRMLAVEGAILALLSSAVAVALLTITGSAVLRALFPGFDWTGSAFDRRSALLAAILASLATSFVGLLPALRVNDRLLRENLTSATRAGGGQFAGLRRTLTVLQAALSLVLISGSGLFVRSLWSATHVDLGIEPAQTLVSQVRFAPLGRGASQEDQRATQLYLQAARRMTRAPGVTSTAVAVGVSFQNQFSTSVRVPGKDSVNFGSGGQPGISAVSPAYFRTAGTAVLAGREFTEADHATSERVAIVSVTMAELAWPNRSPLGECLLLDSDTGTCTRVVGVVEDVKQTSFADGPLAHFYVPLGQENGFSGAVLLTRVSGQRPNVVAALRRELLSLDPTVLFVETSLWSDLLEPRLAPLTLGATVFSAMGSLALLVATAGLFSLVSYSVAQRRHELGVRMALGATPQQVIRLIVREALVSASVGILVGAALFVGLSRFADNLLFETSSRDPLVLGLSALTLLAAATLAALGPAGRARHMNLLTVLRSE